MGVNNVIEREKFFLWIYASGQKTRLRVSKKRRLYSRKIKSNGQRRFILNGRQKEQMVLIMLSRNFTALLE